MFNAYRKLRKRRMNIMKIFVTGVGGQLGHDVMNELAKRVPRASPLAMGSWIRKSLNTSSAITLPNTPVTMITATVMVVIP